jgi:hypothetical protein
MALQVAPMLHRQQQEQQRLLGTASLAGAADHRRQGALRHQSAPLQQQEQQQAWQQEQQQAWQRWLRPQHQQPCSLARWFMRRPCCPRQVHG